MRLTDDVYLVGSGVLGIGLTDDYDCHVYLIDGGDEYALVDAGGGRAIPQILETIRHDGLDPSRLRHILLTHYHADHAGGAAGWKEHNDARIVGHAEGASWLRDGDEEAISLTVARASGQYPPDYRLAPCPVDLEVHEGSTLTIGALRLRVLETPGHARGHVAYLLTGRDRTYLFGGDLIFFGGQVSLLSTYDASLQDLKASIEKIGALSFDALLPGHLTFSLRDGQRHVRAALARFQALAVPTSII